MVNQILKRELKSTKKGNKIFDNQKPSDLNELVENQEVYCKNDLLVDFKVKDWYYDSRLIKLPLTEDEKIIRCQKYVALKILEELQKRNEELKELSTDEYLEVFRRGDEEEFQQIEDDLLSINDVIDLLSFEENQVPRIHFVMNGNKETILCDALSIFLSKDLPFSTSIYTSPNGFYTTLIPLIPEKKYIWEEYEYTRYIEYNEGEKNTPKKKRQRKVKEKVKNDKIS